MFDKRLFSLTPGLGKLIAAKVGALWLSLFADVLLAFVMANLLVSVMQCIFNVAQGVGMILPTQSIVLAALTLLAVCLVKYLTSRAAAAFGTEAAERVKIALRERLYRKMLRLGPAYSSRVRTADVVQSAGEGIDQIQSFFELFLPQLFYAVLAPITLFVVLLPVNVPAAVVLLVCAPLIVLIVGVVAMSAARAFKKYWGKYTDMGAAFLDGMQGLETLKTFDADERAAVEMDEKAEAFRVMTMNVLQIQLRSLTAMDLVAYGGTAAGIGVAIWQFVTGGMGLSGAMVVVFLSASFFLPLRQLGSYFHVAMNGMTSTKRIFALLDAPEPNHGNSPLPGDGRNLSVTFHNVGYRYTETKENEAQSEGAAALSDVSLTARPGVLTAIVGESGSGKSTTAALLAGTLTGYEGTISISSGDDAVELRDLDSSALTSAVMLVSSRSHLFAGTLRDNLMMADPAANDDMLWQALELAHIADLVREQPEGLDMLIAPDASNLSGGQRQRIAIARALLRDCPIYIFDEATSSVDADSEAIILDIIHELVQTATVIMVTHRMANAVDAGQVVVFDHGHVAETGTHNELMVADGTYAKLFRTQQVIEQVGHRRTSSDVVELIESESSEETTSPSPTASMLSTPMSTGTLIRRLLHEVGPMRPLMVVACIFGTLGHLSATFLPVFGIFALFATLGKPVWGMNVTAAIVAMAVCAVVRGVMRYAEQYMNHNVAFRLLALFRSKAFAAMRRLAPAKLDGRGKGDLIALITTDVELLEIFFAHTISPVIIAIATTVVFVVALGFLNPWFIPLLLVMHLLVGVLLPRLFSAGVRYLGPNLRKNSASLDDAMLDDMRGLDEIIRFNVGERRLTSILDKSRKLWRQRVKLSANNGRFNGLGGVLVVLATAFAGVLALVLAWYGFATVNGVGGVFAAVVLIASSFGPTLALSALPGSLTQTFASARRLFALMDEVPAVEETGTSTPDYDGMALEHVRFTYPDRAQDSDDAVIFADLSLDIPTHGILGIQGPSGRGKSTMLKLLMRYWDPQSGRVTMSGEDIHDIDPHHRRRVQTMLAQETYLFDGTIRENLRIANQDADDETMRAALANASVLDLVDSLPDGLDTQVGELGGRLSEGERQRIGLARIFLRDADLVLLDEPTSRLDAFNEAVILQSVNALANERDTAIVLVSHRDSTMRVAGHIIHV